MTENKPRASAAGWLVVLCVFLSALYLALPTAHHSYDAVAYALDVEYAVVTGSFERVWHDYHILYDPLVYALHALGRPAGLHPLMTMQIVNALAGALVATLLAALLHARTRSRLLAACGGLALGLCGSFWYYSTNAQPYVVSAARRCLPPSPARSSPCLTFTSGITSPGPTRSRASKASGPISSHPRTRSTIRTSSHDRTARRPSTWASCVASLRPRWAAAERFFRRLSTSSLWP